MKPWIGIVLAICVLVVWAAVGFAPYYLGDWTGLKNSTDRGQFGDMFGAVNSLFSALAFLGVTYAVMLQTQEMRDQREGAEETLAGMDRANETQKLANRLIEISNIVQVNANHLIQAQINVAIVKTEIDELLSNRSIYHDNPGIKNDYDSKIRVRIELLGRHMNELSKDPADAADHQGQPRS